MRSHLKKPNPAADTSVSPSRSLAIALPCRFGLAVARVAVTACSDPQGPGVKGDVTSKATIAGWGEVGPQCSAGSSHFEPRGRKLTHLAQVGGEGVIEGV